MKRRACLIFLSSSAALGACAPQPNAPIPLASERSVLVPSELAVLAASRVYEGTPGAITFGGASGRSALYLQFPAEWRARGAPLRAFIALEPEASAMTGGEPVRVEAWRVRSEWRADALHSWSEKPELAPPYASATASSSPPASLRIEVTELARFAANNPELDHGVALIATGGAGHGVSFTTGANGGNPPRLEIYSR